MIYTSRYLLATLLVLGSLAALYLLPVRRLLHYVWVYYQVAIVVAVVVIPVAYMLRVVFLKTMYALTAASQPAKQVLADSHPAANQAYPAAKPLPSTNVLLS